MTHYFRMGTIKAHEEKVDAVAQDTIAKALTIRHQSKGRGITCQDEASLYGAVS